MKYLFEKLHGLVWVTIFIMLLPAGTMAVENEVVEMGQVMTLDYGKYEFEILPFNSGQQEVKKAVVGFKKAEKGCIDWTDRGNRLLSPFFQVEPGDVIEVDITDGVTTTVKRVTEEIKQFILQSKKISSETLLEKFFLPGQKVNVVIGLTVLKDDIDIERRVAGLVKLAGSKNFVPAEKTDNLPFISGTLNLKGLLELSKSEEVGTIEENIGIFLN